MHDMRELKEMLEEELEKITKHGKVTAGILDTVDKLTHSIKSIETIMAMNEAGYSNRMSYGRNGDASYGYNRRSYADGSYADGSYADGSYDDGNSYRIRKDGMRDQRYNYSRGYSRELKQDLEHLMHTVGNEEEKRMLKSFIKQLDND